MTGQAAATPAPSAWAVELDRVTAGYGRRTILHALTARVPYGQTVGVGGPNGAGKTTLLRVIIGLLIPKEGEVRLFGRPLKSQRDRHWARRQIGYVPQEQVAGDLPITVYDAVLLGRWGRTYAGWRRPGPADRAAVLHWLDWVGLAHLAQRDVRELSGGQRQRVALARALAGEPRLLVLDEPTTHLDAEAQAELIGLLQRLRQDLGLTTLIVSHEAAVLAACAERRWTLTGGRLVPDAPEHCTGAEEGNHV